MHSRDSNENNTSRAVCKSLCLKQIHIEWQPLQRKPDCSYGFLPFIELGISHLFLTPEGNWCLGQYASSGLAWSPGRPTKLVHITCM